MNIEEHIKDDFNKFKCINCFLSDISTISVTCNHWSHSGTVNIDIIDKLKELQMLRGLGMCLKTKEIEWSASVEQVKERINNMEGEIKTQEQQIEELKQELKKKDELIEAYSKVLKQELK